MHFMYSLNINHVQFENTSNVQFEHIYSLNIIHVQFENTSNVQFEHIVYIMPTVLYT